MVAGFPWQEGLEREWGHQKCNSSHFGSYIFGTFTANANITIQRHEVPYRPSNDLKMFDLE